MSGFLAALRSRRTALWLIVGMAVYASAMTLVPQGAIDVPEVAAWREAYPLLAGVAAVLGLHRAWSNPAFVVAVAWLTLSTATCAWERSRVALRQWRRWRDPERSGYASALGAAPSAGIAWSAAGPPEPSALGAALGMRARPAGEGVWATSRLFGIAGSPLFHWSLALLAVVAIVNQLTTWNGTMGVVTGHPRADERASYDSLAEGPLGGFRPSGDSIALERTEASHVVDGADRGPAAFVSVTRGGAVVREGWVFANMPMRLAGRTLHLTSEGLGAVFVTKLADGTVAGGAQMLAKRDDLANGSRVQRDMTVGTASGDVVIRVYMSLRAIEAGEKDPGGAKRGVLEYEILDAAGQPGPTRTLAVGEGITVPDGSATVVYEGFGYSADLMAVHEPWLGLLGPVLFLGLLGAVLAILLPARGVYVRLDPAPADGARLRVVSRGARIDAGFEDRVLAALDRIGPQAQADDEGERG